MNRDSDENQWNQNRWNQNQGQDRWNLNGQNQSQDRWNLNGQNQDQNQWNQDSWNQTNQNQWNPNSQNQNNYYYYQKRGYSEPNVSYQHIPTEPKKRTGVTILVTLFVIIFAALFVGVIAIILWQVANKETSSGALGTTPYTQEEQGEYWEDTPDTPEVMLREAPESGYFKEAVKKVFGKSLEEVTAAEYQSITEIKISEEDGYQIFAYKQADGTEGKAYIVNDNIEYRDLQCFANLEKIDIGRHEFGQEDLYGLKKLYAIYSGTSVYSLLDVVQYKENITEIGLHSGFMGTSTEDIIYFPNIEKVYLDADSLEELDSLSVLEHLKELHIVTDEFGGYTDTAVFAKLYDFTELEVLSIDCPSLRDIGFLENMKKLRELTIINAEILNLDALLYRADTLEKLTVWHTYEVTDYSPVFQLTNLTQLAVELTDDVAVVPDMSGFKNLKTLAIGRAEGLDNIATVTGLEELALVGTYNGSIGPVAQLTNLKKLTVQDVSVYDGDLSSLAAMSGLEELVLDESFIWSDISCLFSIPNLKSLSLENATFGMDFAKVADCSSLEYLNMKDVRIYGLINGEWNYSGDDIILKVVENPEFFNHFPNMKELYLPNHELTDVNFAGNLKQLEILDISNSYVTDLTPLSGLENLKSVLCADCPIAKMADLDNKVVRGLY